MLSVGDGPFVAIVVKFDGYLALRVGHNPNEGRQNALAVTPLINEGNLATAVE